MKIPLAQQSYERTTYGLPPQRMRNLIIEPPAVPGRSGTVLPFSGLSDGVYLGTSPIRALDQNDGLFNGDIIAVAGSDVIRIAQDLSTSNLGGALGDGYVTIAASNIEAGISAGGKGYILNGSGLNEITDPDFPEVSSVAQTNGYHLWTRKDTGQFVWSAILDGQDYDALDFATAEKSPDNLLRVIVDHEEVFLFGTRTIERWVNTTSSETPFIPRPGGLIQRGAASAASIAQADNSIFWVGDDGIVYRMEGVTPRRVSTFAIEEQIGLLAFDDREGLQGESYAKEGHTYYDLTIPGQGTWSFDLASGTWLEKSTWNQSVYKASKFVRAWGKVWAGSRLDGQIYELNPKKYNDGSNPIERVITAGVPIDDSRVSINNLVLDMQPGLGLSQGQGEFPEIMMRYSDDLGFTWSNERRATMGRIGEYQNAPHWHRLGTMRAPGRIFEFKMTDPVPFILHGARINVGFA